MTWCVVLALVVGTISQAALAQAPKTPFQHPGLFNSRAELDFIKAKVAAKEEPWFAALTALQNSPTGKLDYKPNGGKPFDPPVIHVSFKDPSYKANDTKPWEDSKAAYGQALLWTMTGKEQYAQNAAGILNAYAGITDLSGKDRMDQHLLVGSFWCMGLVQAAELLRPATTIWKEGEQKAFADALRKVWVPPMKDFAAGYNGNWDSCVTAAVMAMGVYLDDHALFDSAVINYQKGAAKTPNGSVPFYLGLNWSPDGKQPGWTQETYRDKARKTNAHEQGGVHGIVQSAEIAWHQGVDLYSQLDNRLMYAVEGAAGRAAEWQKEDPRGVGIRFSCFYEMAYNHYHNRKGLEMPNVEAALKLPGYRPELARHAYSPNIFGTLTCYGLGTTFKTMPQEK